MLFQLFSYYYVNTRNWLTWNIFSGAHNDFSVPVIIHIIYYLNWIITILCKKNATEKNSSKNFTRLYRLNLGHFNIFNILCLCQLVINSLLEVEEIEKVPSLSIPLFLSHFKWPICIRKTWCLSISKIISIVPRNIYLFLSLSLSPVLEYLSPTISRLFIIYFHLDILFQTC